MRRRCVTIMDMDSVFHRYAYALNAQQLLLFENGSARHAGKTARRIGASLRYTPKTTAPLKSGGEPNLIIACFDCGDGGRKEMFPAYKGHRVHSKPDNIEIYRKAFMQEFRTLYPEDGVGTLQDPPVLRLHDAAFNAEADDLVATSASVCKEMGFSSMIYSSDKDLLQLVDDRSECCAYNTNTKKFLKEKDVKNRLGVLPRDLLPFRALMGDSSDGIPGVSGVGVKAAAQLVNAHKTLPKIFKAQKSAKGKRAQQMRECGLEKALLYEKVMTLQSCNEAKVQVKSFLEKYLA